ncbi:MAG: hypothetical protein ABEJ83_05335 [Candidatus Nanohaloarchaea archaeon]
MDQAKLSLLLLTAVIVTASGCGENGGPSFGTKKAISIQDFSVTPKEIYAGSSVTATLAARNTGLLNATVLVSNQSAPVNRQKGSQVLTSYCPDIFTLNPSDFSVQSSTAPEKKSSYKLRPGERIRMSWILKQNDKSRVPIFGYKCNLRFELPFKYSVYAYRQLQIKNSTEVSGSPDLGYKSSEGPMKIGIETIGETTQKQATYLKSDTKELLVQLKNKQPKESSFRGIVKLENPLISVSDNLRIKEQSCNFNVKEPGDHDIPEISELPTAEQRMLGMYGQAAEYMQAAEQDNKYAKIVTPEKPIRLYQGQSKILRCRFEADKKLDKPSIRGEISVVTDYTYVRDLGSKRIEVKSRGR